MVLEHLVTLYSQLRHLLQTYLFGNIKRIQPQFFFAWMVEPSINTLKQFEDMRLGNILKNNLSVR